jgi:hypothetical protein
MTDDEKKRFVEMATKDKMRYDQEMKSYVPSPNANGTKKRRGSQKEKDPDAPKRPL